MCTVARRLRPPVDTPSFTQIPHRASRVAGRDHERRKADGVTTLGREYLRASDHQPEVWKSSCQLRSRAFARRRCSSRSDALGCWLGPCCCPWLCVCASCCWNGCSCAVGPSPFIAVNGRRPLPSTPLLRRPAMFTRLTCRSHSKFRRRDSESSVCNICLRVVRGVIGGGGGGRLYG